MKMAVLKHLHPMIGIDLHDEIAPPSIPAPKIPHLTFGLLCLPPWGVVTGKVNGDVWTTHAMSLARGTDMGFFIPHIPLPVAPANILAPLYFLASGSKSHFGAHNHLTPKGPLAFACLGRVNLNVNCGAPPLPSGFVFALFQLTWQGVTLGDFIAGTLHMLVDIAVQHALNEVLGSRGLGKALTWLNRKVGGALTMPTYKVLVALSLSRDPVVPAAIEALMKNKRIIPFVRFGLLENVPEVLAGYVIGTPIGYSPDRAYVSKGEGYADQAQDAVAEGIDRGVDKIDRALHRFFDSPAIEQHPTSGPTSGPPLAPAPPTVPPGAPPTTVPSPAPQAPPTPPAGGGH